MNYELFELKRVLNLSSLSDFNEYEKPKDFKVIQNSLDDLFFRSNDLSSKNLKEDYFSGPKEDINSTKNIQFKQVISSGLKGYFQVLAFLTSSNTIILRLSIFKKFEEEKNQYDPELYLDSPYIQFLHQFKQNPLSSISIEEYGKWLVCITEEREVFVVPVCKIFFPTQNSNEWPFKYPFTKFKKEISPLASYLFPLNEKKTFNFLDDVKDVKLCSTKKVSSKSNGTKMICSIFWKAPDQNCYVIIGTDKGFVIIFNLQNQNVEQTIGGFEEIENFQLVSDIKNNFQYLLVSSKKGLFFQLLLSQMGEKDHITIVQKSSEYSKFFQPLKLDQLLKEYPCKVNISIDKKKGPLVCVQKNKQLTIYDPDTIKLPYYTYQLKDKVSKIYNTDSILFTKKHDKIWVISKLLSSNDYKNDSILQEFIVNEKIQGFLPNLVDSNLETVYIWSRNSLYELKQKNKPKEIFNYLLKNNSIPFTKLEQFGKTFSLNLLKIYEKCANDLFEKNQISLSLPFYKLSNISENDFVKKFVSVYEIEIVIDYLLNILKNPSALTLYKKKEISQMLLNIYLYQYFNQNLELSVLENYLNTLESNSSLLDTLITKGLISTAVQLGKKSKLTDLNELLVKKGFYNLNDKELEVFYDNKIQIDQNLYLNQTKFKFLFEPKNDQLLKLIPSLNQQDLLTIITKMNQNEPKNSLIFSSLLNYLNYLKNQSNEGYQNLLYTFSQERLNETLFNSNELISQCLKYENYNSLAKLFDMNGLYIESLYCKLKNERNDVKILKLYEENLNKKDLKRVTYLIFKFWKDYQLDISKLEEFCLKNINTLGESIMNYIKIDPDLKFSQKFYLKVNLNHIKLLKKNMSYNVDLQTQIFQNIKSDKSNFEYPISNLKKIIYFTCGHKFEYNEFEKVVQDFKIKMRKEFSLQNTVESKLMEEKFKNINTKKEEKEENINLLQFHGKLQEKYNKEKYEIQRNTFHQNEKLYLNTLTSTIIGEDYGLYKNEEIMNNSCPNCVYHYFKNLDQ